MKLIFALLLLSAACSAQTITPKQAQKLSGEIVSCIKKYSIFNDSLDFAAIQKDFEQHPDSFDTYEKVGLFYTRQLRKAGDNHSFYTTKNTIEKYSAKQKENIAFSYKLLEGNIGYLSIPGFLSTDNEVTNGFANQINNAIREIDSHSTIIGWVVDLRDDNGGNMWPMVAGLLPLIGNETPGYFVAAGQKKPIPWKPGAPMYGVTVKEPYQLKVPGAKIAVLYSNQTASSGEMTAICFAGIPGSRSFGSNTAGFTTANQVHYLSDDNILVLAGSYVLDRNMKVYTGSIVPDLLIEKTDNDNVLHQAISWLKEK